MKGTFKMRNTKKITGISKDGFITDHEGIDNVPTILKIPVFYSTSGLVDFIEHKSKREYKDHKSLNTSKNPALADNLRTGGSYSLEEFNNNCVHRYHNGQDGGQFLN